ncbi:MAG: hypothetical protein FMNOHCHN_00579 [Ignavibacteriaceae bacterium]|nr:hypothetical protein [Ignavibacteriaceae bacterium]
MKTFFPGTGDYLVAKEKMTILGERKIKILMS